PTAVATSATATTPAAATTAGTATTPAMSTTRESATTSAAMAARPAAVTRAAATIPGGKPLPEGHALRALPKGMTRELTEPRKQYLWYTAELAEAHFMNEHPRPYRPLGCRLP